jgi:hypothetical protein
MANLAGLAALAALGYGAHEYFKKKDATPTVKKDDTTNSAETTVVSNLLKGSGPTITPEMRDNAIKSGNDITEGERVTSELNSSRYNEDRGNRILKEMRDSETVKPKKKIVSKTTRSIGKPKADDASVTSDQYLGTPESEEDRISRMGKLMSNYGARRTQTSPKAPVTTVSPSRPPLFPPGTPPEEVNNSVPEMRSNIMGQKRGGMVKKMASGGMTSKPSSASRRGDGIAQKGKTNCKMR